MPESPGKKLFVSAFWAFIENFSHSKELKNCEGSFKGPNRTIFEK